MNIILKVIKNSVSDSSILHASHRFDESGGTVGRGYESDWVLADVRQRLSRTHFSIQFYDQKFWLIDKSKNGVRIGGVFVERGVPVPLNEGDQLQAGDYSMAVHLEEENKRPVPDKTRPPSPFSSMSDASAGDDDVDSIGKMIEDTFRPDAPGTPVSAQETWPKIMSDPSPSDPQPFFDKWNEAEGGTLFRKQASVPIKPRGGSEGDHLPQEHEPIILPSVARFPDPPRATSSGSSRKQEQPEPRDKHPGKSVDDLFDFEDMLPASDVSPQGNDPALAIPEDPKFIPDDGISIPDDDIWTDDTTPNTVAPSHFTRHPTSGPAFHPADTAPDRASKGSAVPPLPSQPSGPTVTAGEPVPSQTAPGTDAMWQRFLDGAAVDPTTVAGVDPETSLAQSGALLRALVVGLYNLLQAQSSLKEEMDVCQTLVRSHNNNPFRVFFSHDEVLANLLGSPQAGFLNSIEAVEDAIKKVQLHEMVTLSAAQEIMRALLKQLDPTFTEQQVGAPRGLNGILPNTHKAKCWDFFCSHYAKVAEEFHDRRESALGVNFAHVYRHHKDKMTGNE